MATTQRILVAMSTFSVGAFLLNFQNSVILMNNEGLMIPKTKSAVMNIFPTICASSKYALFILLLPILQGYAVYPRRSLEALTHNKQKAASG